MIYFLIFLISYLIGSISGSLTISKLFFNEDIRKKGSGNAGTTNTFRVYGKKYARIAFLIDILKGILAVFIASLFKTEYGIYLAATSVVIGHCWPIFYNFKGGKGVATSFGVNLYIVPIAALVQFVVFTIINYTMSFVSLASILSMISAVIVTLLLYIKNTPLIITIILNTIIVIITHKDNIKRLKNKEENKTNLIKNI